jgi:autophagy-related protein 11
MAQDHIHHILSLFAAQYKALSLAYQNLDHHLAPLREEWNTLSRTADERLKEQVELLESAPNDLAILPKVPIHPAFWSKRDSAGNVVSRGKDETKDKTLADYIHARKMEEVIDTCRASHGEQ